MALPVQTESPRQSKLKQLAANLPVASSRIAASQKAARDMQVQNAVKSAPQSAPITSAAQTTGASVAQTAGTQQLQQNEQTAQAANQVGQLGQAEAVQQTASRIGDLQAGQRNQELDNLERFAALNRDAKEELYDKQMVFERDELGRQKMNDIQLADYTRANAASNEAFEQRSQQAKQAAARQLQMMETAHRLILADLDQKYAVADQAADQQAKIDIANAKKAAEEAMTRAKNKAANKSAAWGAAGSIAGGVAGAVLSGGNPAGAMAGAQAGGALGTGIANNT